MLDTFREENQRRKLWKKFIDILKITYIEIIIRQKNSMNSQVLVKTKNNKTTVNLLKQCLTKQKENNENLKKASGKMKKNIENIANVHSKIQELSSAAKCVLEKFSSMTSSLEQCINIIDEESESSIREKKLAKLAQKLKNDKKDSVLLQKIQYIQKCARGQIGEFIQSSIAQGNCSSPKQIRGYQSKVKAKLCELIKKKYGCMNKFLEIFPGALIPTTQLGAYFRQLGLTRSQALMLLKILDPSNQGTITHQYFKAIIQYITQKQIQQYYRNVQELVAVWKAKNLNLLNVFQMADSRRFDVVTPNELQKAFLKFIPDQPQSKIKKWVNIINQNKDNKVTREEFIDMMRGFYLMNEFDEFPEQYIKKYPELNNKGADAHKRNMSAVRQLNIVLKQKGMKKKQVFHYIDFNKSGDVDKKQIIEGLKSLGVRIGLIGRFLCVLSQKQTEFIDIEEWVRILSIDSQSSHQSRLKPKNLEETKQTLKFEIVKKNKKLNKTKNIRKSQDIQRIKSADEKKTVKGKRNNSNKSRRSNRSHSKRKDQKFNQPVFKEAEKKFGNGKNHLKKSSKRKNKHEYLFLNEILDKNYPQKNDLHQDEDFKILEKVINHENKPKKKKTKEKGADGNDGKEELKITQKLITEIKEKGTDGKESKMLQNILKDCSKMQQIQNQLIFQNLFKSHSSKRGEKLQQFNILQHIGLFCQKDAKGYKLLDYVSDGTSQLQKRRDTLLQKAKKLKKSKKPYQDTQFPANLASIIGNNQKTKIHNYKKLEWKHFKDLQKGFELFGQEVQPDDIQQGGLGDCYLLASFSGLAEYRNMVERLFQYADMEIGYFLIWLCIDGLWRLVELDGYLPCWTGTNQIAFGSSNNGKLWVSLLEKAYAKCYGSYNNIEGGIQSQAIKDLTGCPGIYKQLKNKNEDQVWQELQEANQKQYIMNAGTKNKEGTTVDGHQQSVDKVNGIVYGHAYSILDCKVINNQKIIQLRNPWGNTQWKGDQWADSASKWTDETIKKVGHKINEKDGLFWMKFENFIKFFESYTINYLRPQHIYKQKPLKSTTQALIKIPTNQFTSGYLIASHQDHRHKSIPRNTPYDSFNYSKCFIYNQKQEKVIQSYQPSQCLNSRETFKQFNNVNKYPSGCYVMMILQFAQSTNINIGFYADKLANLEIQTNCQRYEEKLAYFEQNLPQTKKHETKSFISWSTQFSQNTYLCFKNIKSSKLTMKVEVTGKNIQTSTNQLQIEPNSIKSIKIKKINKKQGCEFEYRTSELIRQ